ncbi:uncharacterized protein C8Q71DRAFT_528343 [Rhodofomes roseus]|uniref:Uncharacterized protein n=1 Tax=Rhodofomes roseus TaxID=34475 RepID=A0ABQ8KKF6_9APHY|nr:uncharacterized protein C8Q71DRAFT_528343 [Rhodofomes roseus]KAH9838408.1 hypothetical protein C8Q71DRAFT_528343 [Rhodofomes roseus]
MLPAFCYPSRQCCLFAVVARFLYEVLDSTMVIIDLAHIISLLRLVKGFWKAAYAGTAAVLRCMFVCGTKLAVCLFAILRNSGVI